MQVDQVVGRNRTVANDELSVARVAGVVEPKLAHEKVRPRPEMAGEVEVDGLAAHHEWHAVRPHRHPSVAFPPHSGEVADDAVEDISADALRRLPRAAHDLP